MLARVRFHGCVKRFHPYVTTRHMFSYPSATMLGGYMLAFWTFTLPQVSILGVYMFVFQRFSHVVGFCTLYATVITGISTDPRLANSQLAATRRQDTHFSFPSEHARVYLSVCPGKCDRTTPTNGTIRQMCVCVCVSTKIAFWMTTSLSQN